MHLDSEPFFKHNSLTSGLTTLRGRKALLVCGSIWGILGPFPRMPKKKKKNYDQRDSEEGSEFYTLAESLTWCSAI